MGEFRGLSEEDIIARIESGESIAQIAAGIDCNRAMLWRWIEADEERSARCARARQRAAAAWDEMAEAGISNAKDPFELSQAKEMAHHYRWRASKIAPKVYGEKLELAGDAANPLTVVVRRLTNGD